MSQHSAPTPELRIIPTTAPQAHEEHDSQRSAPLIETLKNATTITNPPIVVEADDGTYIILDGANRCYSFVSLGLPHILVQVASYSTGQVTLKTWNHVISRWNTNEFIQRLTSLDAVSLYDGPHKEGIAHIYLPDGTVTALLAPVQTLHERNATLREVVQIYQRNAVLNRTPLNEPEEVWHLYSEANALMVFPPYMPQDIMNAARHRAYLPPGISRHLVQGRALGINYPMAILRDKSKPIEQKNADLQAWVTQKLMNRAIRYYAEATYQFSE